MKELLKAEKIHKSIVKIDKEIIKLEKILDTVVRNNVTVKVKSRMLSYSEHVEKYEEKEESSCGSFTFVLAGGWSCSSKKEWDLDNTLTSTEFVIMYAKLLDYKKETRKSLIKDLGILLYFKVCVCISVRFIIFALFFYLEK